MVKGYEDKLSQDAIQRINNVKHKQIAIEIAKQLLYQDQRCKSLKLINHDELIQLLMIGKTYKDCMIIFNSYINQIANIETLYNNIEEEK